MPAFAIARYKAGTCFILLPCAIWRRSFLYFWISAHFQKHFIRIGDGQGLFNQAMLNQDAMIRRYCQRRWMGLRRMGLRSALAWFWVFHCTMLTRILIAVIGRCGPSNLNSGIRRCHYSGPSGKSDDWRRQRSSYQPSAKTGRQRGAEAVAEPGRPDTVG